MKRVSDLTAHDGYRMRMVSNAVSHAFARRLVGEGVTVAEWAMLRLLYESEQAAPSSLTRSMGITKGAVSRLADRLVGKGLVARAENPGDKRAHWLSLTADGRAKLPDLAALADENDSRFFAVLGADERRSLRGLLDALIERHGLSGVPTD